MGQNHADMAADEWITFPGGELEGQRPKALCPACRDALAADALRGRLASRRRALCFQCYRADLDRDRALKAAGCIDTASEQRFQFQLPLEPIDRPRLDALKAARAASRAATPAYIDRRHHAQIEARHALARIAAGLRERGLGAAATADHERVMVHAVHAAELQLPDAWLPFVLSR